MLSFSHANVPLTGSLSQHDQDLTKGGAHPHLGKFSQLTTRILKLQAVHTVAAHHRSNVGLDATQELGLIREVWMI